MLASCVSVLGRTFPLGDKESLLLNTPPAPPQCIIGGRGPFQEPLGFWKEGMELYVDCFLLNAHSYSKFNL